MHKLMSQIALAADYERAAREQMEPAVWGVASGGAGTEQALRANRSAFENVHIVPRVLASVSAGTTQTIILEQTVRHPMLLAPIGYQRLYAEQGELAAAQAADATDTGMIVSTLSSVCLKDLAASTEAPLWFQLYCQPRLEDTITLVQRAEAAGYQALVITLDTPIQMLMPAALRAGFKMPAHIRAANLEGLSETSYRALDPDESLIFQGAMADAPTWRQIEHIIAQTTLPIFMKGIMHPDDARRAMAVGAKGIIVSNHGGRALGSSPASLKQLPEIRRALGERATILFDGGIRSGEDVFKAIALGADAVLIGRLQIYALAVGGALGVAHLVKMLREELELAMALAGIARVEEINAETVEAAISC